MNDLSVVVFFIIVWFIFAQFLFCFIITLYLSLSRSLGIFFFTTHTFILNIYITPFCLSEISSSSSSWISVILIIFFYMSKREKRHLDLDLFFNIGFCWFFFLFSQCNHHQYIIIIINIQYKTHTDTFHSIDLQQKTTLKNEFNFC